MRCRVIRDARGAAGLSGRRVHPGALLPLSPDRGGTKAMDTQPRQEGNVLVAPTGEDPLAEIDLLLQTRLEHEHEIAEEIAKVAAARLRFSTNFVRICRDQIRPPMEAIIERLRRNGGGGMVV